MHHLSPANSEDPYTLVEDAYLFGWDATPGIVSIWANREGQAIIWRREGKHVTCTRERFRPWLFAATLDDLAYLGSALVSASAPGGSTAAITYRELNGPTESYRYLLSARNGRFLERMLVDGVTRRLGRQIKSINELPYEYYRVGPVEQYLMQCGKVYFRDLTYNDLH